jgi:hypothetical protein
MQRTHNKCILQLLHTIKYHNVYLLYFFRYIQLAKLESNVRSQDFFSVLAFISQNPIGVSIVWDFTRYDSSHKRHKLSLTELIQWKLKHADVTWKHDSSVLLVLLSISFVHFNSYEVPFPWRMQFSLYMQPMSFDFSDKSFWSSVWHYTSMCTFNSLQYLDSILFAHDIMGEQNVPFKATPRVYLPIILFPVSFLIHICDLGYFIQWSDWLWAGWLAFNKCFSCSQNVDTSSGTRTASCKILWVVFIGYL